MGDKGQKDKNKEHKQKFVKQNKDARKKTDKQQKGNP